MLGLLEPMDDGIGNVVEYSRRGVGAKAAGSGGNGGGVDDILKRLGNVESDVSELKVEVGKIAATLPHLATAAAVAEISAVIPHLATKREIASMEAKLIRWFIGTAATLAGLSFTFAKFVH